MDHLHGCRGAIEAGPVTKMGALGEMGSVYCRDPDGNLIEISFLSRPLTLTMASAFRRT